MTKTQNLPAEWGGKDVEEFDGGSTIVQKSDLLGVPFLIGEVVFQNGDFGQYVTVHFVDQTNSEAVFNDGSSGVMRQITAYLKQKNLISEDEKPSGTYPVRLLCKRGLRVSEYEGPGGRPARTYYIA